MLMKVIRDDGTIKTVRALDVGMLAKAGHIVAFKCSEGWVEVRRKQNARHRVPERRVLTSL